MLALHASPLAFSPAAALRPTPVATRAPVTMVAKELEDLATELNPAIGYFDPLGLGSADFWSKGNDATIGWLRHSEIKHGRVAMFAFVGYIAQYNGLHFGFPLSLPEDTNLQYAAGLTPPEQWDALSIEGKFQILVFIGFLEFWGELGAGSGQGQKHYMKGGKPGDYPDFPAKNVIPVTPIGVMNLFDPLGVSKKQTDAQKERGLLVEVNNGRLAMIGIIAFLQEQAMPGSVPWGPHLAEYSGNVMAPLQ